MIENPPNQDDTSKKFDELREVVEAVERGERFKEISTDDLNAELTSIRRNRPKPHKTSTPELHEKLPEFTREDAEKMNKRFPDTF